MRGDEESTLAKPSKTNPSAQDTATIPQYPDWQGSMQAYYGGGATPPYFAANVASPTPHPYMWGTQHAFMPPFGTPVPYPAIYPPAGVYAHPNVAAAPNVMPTSMEIEGRAPNGKDRNISKKVKEVTGVGKAGSGSGNDGATQSAESENEGSSDASDNDNNQGNPQDSVPGNPNVSMPGTNMNIEMNLWNANSTGNGTAKIGANFSGHSQAPMAGREGVLTNRWMHDDRELKKEKRKQSNRESARRSRLRKQAECEELQAKVEKLNNENQTLRDELQRISEKCQKLASENNSIKEELSKVNGSEAVSDFEINNANRQ